MARLLDKIICACRESNVRVRVIRVQMSMRSMSLRAISFRQSVSTDHSPFLSESIGAVDIPTQTALSIG